jgi:hypothetical protein
MIRSNVRVLSSLVLSAALCWSLLPIAQAVAQEAPSGEQSGTEQAVPESTAPDATDSSDTSDSNSAGDAAGDATGDAASDSSGDSASAAPAADPVKNLNTIPEDGMGSDAWWSGTTRLVREILQKRPNEDVVICIGGCVERLDRVVYAQVAEPAPMKPVAAVKDAAPSPEAPASAAVAAVKPVAAAKISEPASGPALINGALPFAPGLEELRPAISTPAKATATVQGDTALPQFVPAMAQPNVTEPAGAPQAK